MNLTTRSLLLLSLTSLVSVSASLWNDGNKVSLEAEAVLLPKRNLTSSLLFECTLLEVDCFSVSELEYSKKPPGDRRMEEEEDVTEDVYEMPSRVACVTGDGEEYEIHDNGEWDIDMIVKSPLIGGDFTSGSTTIQMPFIYAQGQITYDDGKIPVIDLSSLEEEKVQVINVVDAESDATTSSINSRKLGGVQRKGDSSVAVIRVRTGNDQPTKTAAQLSDDIFGTISDEYNLRSGYQSCSGNQLNFYPGTGNGLVNGVLEIKLPGSSKGVSSRTIERLTTTKLYQIGFPSNIYDHVMYILPQNVDFQGGAAYAYIGWTRSVYWNIYGSIYLVLMHEIGHNLGHKHSGYNGESYADRTCWMGSHVYQDEGPDACFNGAKSWWFGWYDDRHKQAEPSTEALDLNLVGVDDYLNGQTTPGEHYVVMRLKEGAEDLYVMYNRAEGVNSGTAGQPDEVTIVEQKGDKQQSWLLGHLVAGETYTKSNWASSGQSLVIKVCAMNAGEPDYAKVIVYVDGSSFASCDDVIPSPTQLPTKLPTYFTTTESEEIESPTSLPTSLPTISPTKSPTVAEETKPPTSSPTSSPTQSATGGPNISVHYYVATNWKTLPAAGLKSLTPYKQEMVETINFKAGGKQFAGSERKHNVAALYEGYLEIPSDGKSKDICIVSNDGSKLYIDGVLKIDNDGIHDDRRKCQKFSLSGSHKITIEFFETDRKSSATMMLKWKLHGLPHTVIPASAWLDAPPTPTPTASPTASPTDLPTNPPTLIPSSVPTGSPSSVPSIKSSGLPSSVPSVTPTDLPTLIPSIIPTGSPSSIPSVTPTDSPTLIPSIVPTGSPSSVPSVTKTRSPSILPSVAPTDSLTFFPSIIPTDSPSSVPSLTPTDSPTLITSSVPTGSPSSVPSIKPTGSPSSVPSVLPTDSPTLIPSSVPTGLPSSLPSVTPTDSPTLIPSSVPTGSPSSVPTVTPTDSLTLIPSIKPTGSPSSVPSVLPTDSPTLMPSSVPTGLPSSSPSVTPTDSPTLITSSVPTGSPSSVPSIKSSGLPSSVPSVIPTDSLTLIPSIQPTGSPSSVPSLTPTDSPTIIPSSIPTNQPSSQPSHEPTGISMTLTPTSTPQNILVKYYVANNWSTLPAAGLNNITSYKEEMIETINFRHGTSGLFAGSGRSENIAASFEGFLDFPSGVPSTELCIISNDGSKLYIDDFLEIDNDGVHENVRKCKSFTLSGPQKVTIEFFQSTGAKSMVFKWALGNTKQVIVPVSAWLGSVVIDKPSTTPSMEPSSMPSKTPRPSNTASGKPSMSPSSSSNSEPTETPICSDDTTWYHDGKSSNNCGWVYSKPSKRCPLSSEGGVLAFEACPIACGDLRTKPAKPCNMPECNNEESFWESQRGGKCDWFIQKDPINRCKILGAKLPDEAMFAYETCTQCNRCISMTSMPTSTPSITPTSDGGISCSTLYEPVICSPGDEIFTNACVASKEGGYDSDDCVPYSAPTSLPSSTPTSQSSTTDSSPICSDDTSWRWEGKSSKHCGWIYMSPSKNCSKRSVEGVPASEACPIACGDFRSKACDIPKCSDDSWFMWLPKHGGKWKVCNDYLHQHKRGRCRSLGVTALSNDPKFFAYEYCSRCSGRYGNACVP